MKYKNFSSKPFFRFGWIETLIVFLIFLLPFPTSKPFFRFGWIETLTDEKVKRIPALLLNPSSASAGLKQQMLRRVSTFLQLLNPSSASAGLKRH